MSGIYIHIPFCKKACHYCNFHFSTQTQHIDAFVNALLAEIEIQKNYLNEPIQTLYLGGGTPSLLSAQDLERIWKQIHTHFKLSSQIEFTLEANPDDITEEKTKQWIGLGINRLSIGIQSFQPAALAWMNRAHSAEQSHHAIALAKKAGIHNISTDLIYGTPNLSDEDLLKDIQVLKEYEIPHVSCYALTVEERTALHKMIQQHQIENVDSEKQARHFEMVVEALGQLNFEHYEISNFAQAGHRSQHNSNYWKGVPYIGLGPSAHSYNVHSRQWNVANNQLYIQSIQNQIIPFEIENLAVVTRYNEFMMISLRLLEGVDLDAIATQFGAAYLEHTKAISLTHYAEGKIEQTAKGFAITKAARFLADGIASDYFIVD